MNESRRSAMVKTITVCGFGIGLCQSKVALTDGHVLSESDPQAKALNYIANSGSVTHAKYKAGSNCSNCALFQGAGGDIGNCPLFGGKKVAANGWCTAWAPK
jgi:hypothetical protein|tara:strand:+ start:35896 stop:36201 length:306 start_codon:yes stop_codon:yes gene_type:complete